MSVRIVKAVTYDIRFPTSRSGAGSDAMNPDPDYSAAYVTLETDDPRGIAGHGLTFTIGRGTEVCVAAIEALVPHVVGATVDELLADMTPEQIVACVDFRYIDDVLAPGEALEILRANVATKAERERRLLEE